MWECVSLTSDVTAGGKLCFDRSKVMHVMSRRERSRITSTVLAVNRGQGKPYIPLPFLTSPGLTPTLVITYSTNLIITLNFITSHTFTVSHLPPTLFTLIVQRLPTPSSPLIHHSYYHADCERLASEPGSHVALLLVEALASD